MSARFPVKSGAPVQRGPIRPPSTQDVERDVRRGALEALRPTHDVAQPAPPFAEIEEPKDAGLDEMLADDALEGSLMGEAQDPMTEAIPPVDFEDLV